MKLQTPVRVLGRGTFPLLAAGLLACTDASGTLYGDDPINTSTAQPSGDDGGGGSGGEGGALQYLSTTGPCAPSPGSDDAWTYLYGCYFGPSAAASCTFSPGQCHGASTELGTEGSGGYLCAPDKTSCWQSMTKVLVAGATSFSGTQLAFALRQNNGLGDMPLLPSSVVFQSGDIARISAWIAAGAQNN